MGVAILFFIVYSVIQFLTFSDADSQTFTLYLWIIYLLLLSAAIVEAVLMVRSLTLLDHES